MRTDNGHHVSYALLDGCSEQPQLVTSVWSNISMPLVLVCVVSLVDGALIMQGCTWHWSPTTCPCCPCCVCACQFRLCAGQVP
eukprot:366519-Chlamydomonas_euryale.AAC.19